MRSRTNQLGGGVAASRPVRTAWLVASGDPMPELRPLSFAATHGGMLAIDQHGRLHPIEETDQLQRRLGDLSLPLPQRLFERYVGLLLTHGDKCYLVDMMRWHQRQGRPSPDVLRNGAPVPGGIGIVRHGDWVAVAGSRMRIWLSEEGPWAVERARGADAVCALTLDAIQPGEAIVRCGCSAVFLCDSWQSSRRCCRCGARETGEYQQLPPGITGNRSGSRSSGGLQ